MYVNSKATLLAQAIQDLAVGGPYHTPKIAVFTNDIIPGRASLYADFTVADFGGLTNKQAVTWGTPFLNSNQQAEVIAAIVSWLTTSAVGLPITAFGYVLLDNAGTDWILAERFPAPWVFNDGGPPLNFLPRLVWNT